MAIRVDMKKLLSLYPVYHEMDEEKCVEYLDMVISSDNIQTRLRKMRKRLCFTQEKLAQLSGVSKSAITQYERREKDINKASAETLCLKRFLRRAKIKLKEYLT